MLPDEESIYPPPVLRKDIMKLQIGRASCRERV